MILDASSLQLRPSRSQVLRMYCEDVPWVDVWHVKAAGRMIEAHFNPTLRFRDRFKALLISSFYRCSPSGSCCDFAKVRGL